LPVGLDIPEILVILVLALILFGPEKLPEYGAKLGRLVARLRQAGAEVTQPLQQALNQELTRPDPAPAPLRRQFLPPLRPCPGARLHVLPPLRPPSGKRRRLFPDPGLIAVISNLHN
jgi:sec-independent protein translocase protein TatA